MPTCSAVFCSNASGKTSGITYHKFPKNECIRKAWVLRMKRAKWKPSNASVLCSEHFTADCFDRTGQTVRLKAEAMPTLFKFPPHLLKAEKEKPSKERLPLVSDSTVTDILADKLPASQMDKPSPAVKVTSDHCYSCSPNKLKRMLMEAETHLASTKKRHKVEQQKVQRIKKKMNNFQELVASLSVCCENCDQTTSVYQMSENIAVEET